LPAFTALFFADAFGDGIAALRQHKTEAMLIDTQYSPGERLKDWPMRLTMSPAEMR